jgi:hypothetical protein
MDGMADPSLHILDCMTRTPFVPGPVQFFGDAAELNNEILAEVLRLDLASLLPPEPEEPRLVVAHDDPGVGAADEGASFYVHWVISISILVEWDPAHGLLLAIAPPFTETVFLLIGIAFRGLV